MNVLECTRDLLTKQMDSTSQGTPYLKKVELDWMISEVLSHGIGLWFLNFARFLQKEKRRNLAFQEERKDVYIKRQGERLRKWEAKCSGKERTIGLQKRSSVVLLISVTMPLSSQKIPYRHSQEMEVKIPVGPLGYLIT